MSNFRVANIREAFQSYGVKLKIYADYVVKEHGISKICC